MLEDNGLMAQTHKLDRSRSKLLVAKTVLFHTDIISPVTYDTLVRPDPSLPCCGKGKGSHISFPTLIFPPETFSLLASFALCVALPSFSATQNVSSSSFAVRGSSPRPHDVSASFGFECFVLLLSKRDRNAIA